MNNFSDHIPFFEDDSPPHKHENNSGLTNQNVTVKEKTQYSADYLEKLNPEQQQAVMNTEGPLLVLAGAGTGKTRVLTTRISHILHSGLASPQQILAVTFTNKAAREMKMRIGELIGEIVEGMPWLGTFHSIGAKILRRHAELVNLKSNFTILDSDDVTRLLKQLIQAEGLDDKRWPARNLAIMIDSWKNQGLSPEHISESDAHSFGNGMGRELYHNYQHRLKSLNACDFGDLLLHSISIFQHNPDILRDYHSKFRYILVDEYQDTNTAQYLWLRLLAQQPKGQHINLCCVGDDDQSIYGWRGAQVDNILRFEKDFPPAKIIRLERNYRSTSHILKTASHLISHNQGRLGKTLFSDQVNTEEEKVKIHAAWDSEEEARAIGEEIERAQQADHSLNHIAILVRASFQMREFEDRFVTLGLNYRVIGGPRFYERMEIRDAMAYLRVVVQPADDLAFERIINTPKRGLGDATLRILYESARTRAIPLFFAAAEIIETDELKPKARSALRSVVENFRRWQNMLQNTPHRELAEIILDDSGYTSMWLEDRSPEAPTRLENLKEMVRSMEQFESLPSFLEHVALVMDAENDENTDAVNIMTLHSAKGLEFETVFLPGWEEGLFPHQRSLDEGGRSGLEEERRLAYVGLTRAKKHLHIWFVSNRRIHGFWQSTLPSRFLNELPEEHIEVVEMETSYGGYGKSRFKHHNPFYHEYSTSKQKRVQKNIEGKVIARSISETPSDFSINDRIFHIKFGYGHISAIDGHKLTIVFEKAGEKRVLDNFVSKA
ncbi:ATP-dependent DNA helicase [Bartonella henselae]|uniref:DNA 3'-5' helicase n=2 Tax=Bartonella TaxID=773 RepID=X5M591_BARHN|nr:UvrD-helicase domain-containing protein [Bartonella henselae]MDM9996505.1 UvrD-helicase domain-containing protein [Bartonella henselae]OLL41920.1 ATP-dependent DNA helicase [Bartonella henselae]OLL45719.1 ATP-dependent DNA helicase [Bartonella henselae]OLL49024.1 ATP-dependent DNA helicase [Bartonella henselae]OLL49504.1 ATP-dependent DNA helicase [Bartonella henselae]